MAIKPGAPQSGDTIDPKADLRWMRAALVLARRGLGNVWPNPAVGCVLVSDGRVVGRGWTQPGGRPHAETEALRRAGTLARGATAYVSLEPCSHWGRTSPCANALIAAGVRRVVAALEDPDPRVSGSGITRLREAGIAVETVFGAAEAAEINAGFLTRQRLGRPLVTLKLATSLDGKIATAAGESQWITGVSARAYAHKLRAEHDAIMVGTGTVLTDDTPSALIAVSVFDSSTRPVGRAAAPSPTCCTGVSGTAWACVRNRPSPATAARSFTLTVLVPPGGRPVSFHITARLAATNAPFSFA